MNKNSKSVKHAKAVLKYWNKPFCTCLLKYIDELEEKACKSKYYEEHADIFYNELTALREDSTIDKYIIEKDYIPISRLDLMTERLREKGINSIDLEEKKNIQYALGVLYQLRFYIKGE